MSIMILLLTPIIGWYLLIHLYRFAWKKNWVESCMVHELPFQNKQGQGQVKLNLLLHLGMSCFITFLYMAIWASTNAFESQKFLAFAVLTGLIHGVAVAIGLTIELTNKRDGFKQALLAFNAHIAYAIIVGVLLYYNEHNSGIVTDVASLWYITPEINTIVQSK